MMAAAVATNVRDGQSTSSPEPIPRLFRASISAAVPLQTATASVVPLSLAKASSNACVFGPAVIHPESMASRALFSSVSSNSSSDSLAFHMLIQEETFHFRKVDVRLFVVVGAPNIHPIGSRFITHDPFVVGQECLHQFREIEFRS